MDRKEIAAILGAAGLKPLHHFGQNFMIDGMLLEAIVDAGQVGPDDVILEVGPGVGNLTQLLSRRAPRGAVLAVDIDRKLLPAAQRHHADLANITWLLADVLAGKHHIEPRVLQTLRQLRARHRGALKLVSNLPYNTASPLVAELLVEMWRAITADHETPGETPVPISFARLAFTVQWEVAQRLTAGPGTRDYGPLGILVQSMAEVRIIRKIPPGAFWPPPRIHSALVVVVPDPTAIRLIRDALAWQRFLAGIFAHRRQTLGNALKHFHAAGWSPAMTSMLRESSIDPTRRPEQFTIPQLLHVESIGATTPRPADA